MARRPPPRRTYVAFSGGGAKGLLHVGALKAIEDREYDVRAWSGTSIGALVATLKAAGFTADEIVNQENGETIMAKLVEIDPRLKHPVDLFGTISFLRLRRWRLIWMFRLSIRIGGWADAIPFSIVKWISLQGSRLSLLVPIARRLGLTRRRLPGIVSYLIWPVIAIVAVGGVGLYVAALLLEPPNWWLRGGFAIASVIFTLSAVLGAFSVYGLGDANRFRSALNILLSQKMFPGAPIRRIVMSDFGRDRFPTLKIVAANLTMQRLELFSPHNNAEMAVANAVRASIALPVIFKLPRLRLDEKTDQHHILTDGGIVSNLPAWPFDEERELDPEALTIALEILDNAPGRRAPGRLSWPAALVRTGFFGATELNTRGMKNLIHIHLRSDVGVLDFDMKPAKAIQVVREGRDRTSDLLDYAARLATSWTLKCDLIQALVEHALDEPSRISYKGAGRIRVAIAEADAQNSFSLRMKYCSGFGETADQNMLLPMKGTLAGKIWRDGGYDIIHYPFPPDTNLLGAELSALRRLIQGDLRWILCIAIPSPRSPGGRVILCVDGDKMLRRRTETVTFVQDLAASAVTILSADLSKDSAHA